jgi:hypothetical protein
LYAFVFCWRTPPRLSSGQRSAPLLTREEIAFDHRISPQNSLLITVKAKAAQRTGSMGALDARVIQRASVWHEKSVEESRR